MIVVDASAIADLVLDAEQEHPHHLLEGNELHAPELIDFELALVLRGWLASGRIDSSAAAAALARWQRLRVTRQSFAELIGPILDLRHNFSAYDASYIVLARALHAPLLTADPRLAAAAKDVEVILV
jgi:predicted nucleic acid-binding protein